MKGRSQIKTNRKKNLKLKRGFQLKQIKMLDYEASDEDNLVYQEKYTSSSSTPRSENSATN